MKAAMDMGCDIPTVLQTLLENEACLDTKHHHSRRTSNKQLFSIFCYASSHGSEHCHQSPVSFQMYHTTLDFFQTISDQKKFLRFNPACDILLLREVVAKQPEGK